MYWIRQNTSGKLAIVPRPRTGDWLEAEIDGWKASGLSLLISLLQPDEIRELGLEREEWLLIQRGIDAISFPIADRQVPESAKRTAEICALIVRRLRDGCSIGIHCRAGIGRSALLAACVLVLTGQEVADAFQAIADARGVPVPDTLVQREWVEQFRALILDSPTPPA